MGAGKTTLVNHLLRNANGKRLAILVNEFGALPIDADLIEAQEDDIISLSGGCVCCSYGNDLIMAMVDMSKMNPRPDHIILEASGVALPGAIAGSLSLLNDYRIDGIVVLADAETVRERASDKYMADTVQRQLADADLIVLNKTDLVSVEDLSALKDWLHDLVPDCRLVESQQARVPPAIILDGLETELDGHAADKPHQIDRFETVQLDLPDRIDPKTLIEQILVRDPPPLRAKGFCRTLSGELATIQITGKRWEIGKAVREVVPGVVVISAKEPGALE